jgi:ABC-2 type transport system permease protein
MSLHDPKAHAPLIDFSPARVGAMIQRYLFLIRSSWPRMVSMFYWPTLQILIWGFIQMFLIQHSTFFAQAAGVLIGAVLLWDVMFRGQLGFSLSFFEEIWSRNMGHLLVSPLRLSEFIVALMVMSTIRTLIAVIPAAIIAYLIFDFSILSLGVMLGAFLFSLLMFGWAVGLIVSGLALRYGQSAEELAWALLFLLAPIAAVYYPVSILPGWLEPIAYGFPLAHVFEGLRAIIIDGHIRLDHLAWSFGLNAVYIALGVGVFLYFFEQARERGMLLQLGE